MQLGVVGMFKAERLSTCFESEATRSDFPALGEKGMRRPSLQTEGLAEPSIISGSSVSSHEYGSPSQFLIGWQFFRLLYQSLIIIVMVILIESIQMNT